MSCSQFSIKTGWLDKRNEQGIFQKRFICIVPHLFMYYFESEKSDVPKGVIDLQYYTDISIEGSEYDTLKLSTNNESNRSNTLHIFL